MVTGVNNSSGFLHQVRQTPNRKELFQRIDQNADGSVDKTELAAMVAKMQEKTGDTIDIDAAMAAWDQDQSGALSQEEMDAGMQAMRGQGGPPSPAEMFKRIDQNSDDSVDKTELTAFLEKMQEKTGDAADIDATMKAWDQDQNGVLSQEEMDAGMQARRPQGGHPPGGPPPGAPMGPPPEGTSGASTDDDSSAVTDSSTQSTSRLDPFTRVMQNLIDRLRAGYHPCSTRRRDIEAIRRRAVPVENGPPAIMYPALKGPRTPRPGRSG